jgi:hypothetical protein
MAAAWQNLLADAPDVYPEVPVELGVPSGATLKCELRKTQKDGKACRAAKAVKRPSLKPVNKGPY